MPTSTVERTIGAKAEDVFDCIAHIENFRKAIPHIVDVRFLTATKRGVGTKFRETRLMGKREATSELEVTEYVENKRVRLISDQGGVIWDTVFTVEPRGSTTSHLKMVMDARPYKTFAKLTTGLLMAMIQKHLEADLDAVKAYCEP